MKKTIVLSIVISFSFLFSFGQKAAVEVSKNNILYCYLENPIQIVVENSSCKSIIAKSTSGKLEGKDGYYILTPSHAGQDTVLLYKKTKSGLKFIGMREFRVRMIPYPIFKIGSGKSEIPKVEIASQSFVRADYSNLCIDVALDVHASVKRFTVYAIYADSSNYKEITNNGPEINENVKALFQTLKSNDILVFKDIHASGPTSDDMKLEPVIVTIK